jgi:putative DNA primase/helicase
MPKQPEDKKFSELKAPVVPIRSNSLLDKIEPLDYDSLLLSKPIPLEYVLWPWLPTQGIAFIYAATGVGKTLFSMNVAYAIAGGGNFLKYKAIKPRKVLYLDGEMAFPQVHQRLMDIRKQQGDLFFRKNFNLYTPISFEDFSLPDINTPEGQMFYNKKIEDLGIEVLFLDNLSTLSSIDENNSEHWKVIQKWLISLRAKGLSIVMIHHAGKDKKGYRGTSRMLDCADTAISLQDVTDDKMEGEKTFSKKFKVEYQKTRAFGGDDAMPFEVNLSTQGWEFESMEKNNTSRIVDMFGLGMKPMEIVAELGCHRSYVYRIISKARKQGLIRN